MSAIAARRQEFKAPDDDLGVLAGALGVSAVIPGGRSIDPTRAPKQEPEPGLEERLQRAKRAPRHTYNVSDEVHEQAVNAVAFLSGPPHREQIGRLVERAILAEVKRLEILHSGGQPFPEAAGPLRTGKRPGA